MVDNSGQMRTIEAFFAVLLLFSTLAIATSTSPSVDSPNIDELADIGRQAVFVMNEHGELSQLIDAENWTGLEQALVSGLPMGTLFNVSVFDAELNRLNNATISNGLMFDQDMISIMCPCVSQNPTLHVYLVQVQLGTME